MTNRLTDSLHFQTQALVLRSERQRLIASNIANADTPGYVARDMSFSQALKEATSTTGLGSAGTALATQPGHIQPAGGARADTNLVYALPSQTSLDRNTVDLDRERAAFADNAVKYEAALRFINHDVRQMLDAIRGQ
jgi:flagellar basal-body rod protein FlgB